MYLGIRSLSSWYFRYSIWPPPPDFPLAGHLLGFISVRNNFAEAPRIMKLFKMYKSLVEQDFRSNFRVKFHNFFHFPLAFLTESRTFGCGLKHLFFPCTIKASKLSVTITNDCFHTKHSGVNMIRLPDTLQAYILAGNIINENKKPVTINPK